MTVSLFDWLLDSDPAIRWQVMRDLLDTTAEDVAKERRRTAEEGWCGRLLFLQGEDGQWAGGACTPWGNFDWHRNNEPQPWTPTLPTLQLLVTLGVDPESRRVQ